MLWVGYMASAPGSIARSNKRISEQTLVRLEPLQVGQAFLRVGERVGIVLRPEDVDTSYQLPEGLSAPDTARKSEALAIFTARNPHYQLTRSRQNVLRLAPKRHTRCTAYVEQQVGSLSMEEAPVLDVLATIVRQRKPEIPDVPVGYFGRDNAFIQRTEYIFPGGTVAAALDALVLAASGIGWLIAERPGDPDLGPSESYCSTMVFSGQTIASGF